jgi:hypothetical protein
MGVVALVHGAGAPSLMFIAGGGYVLLLGAILWTKRWKG